MLFVLQIDSGARQGSSARLGERPAARSRRRASRVLGNDFRQNAAADISQPPKAAAVQVGEALVAKTEQIEKRGVHVAKGNRLLQGAQPELVGLAHRSTPL